MTHSQNPIGFLTPFVHRSLGPVMLDAVLEETERYSAAITEHPVEVPRGAKDARGSISDHIFLHPKTYSMRGTVSDMPITWRSYRGYAEAGAETRSSSAYHLLVRHFEQREPFDLQTTYALHKNMVIETLVFPRSSRNSNAIIFTAEVREVQIVTPASVVASRSTEDVSGDQAETQAISEIDRGEVVPKEVSVGRQLLGALGG